MISSGSYGDTSVYESSGCKYLIKKEKQGIGSRIYENEVNILNMVSKIRLDDGRVFCQQIIQSRKIRGMTEICCYYIEGDDLHNYVKKKNFTDLEGKRLIVRLFHFLIESTKILHAHGIYHRDIKPENIIFDGKNFYLIDFGMAYSKDGRTTDVLTYLRRPKELIDESQKDFWPSKINPTNEEIDHHQIGRCILRVYNLIVGENCTMEDFLRRREGHWLSEPWLPAEIFSFVASKSS